MDFQSFYKKLPKDVFNYFIEDGTFHVYSDDVKYLPKEYKGRNDVKLDCIDSIIKKLLITEKIPVAEYCNFKLSKKGFPYDFHDFTDICIDDNILASLCSVEIQDNYIKFSYLCEKNINFSSYLDDDLLSITYSLISMYNCVEILYSSPTLESYFNNWGCSSYKIQKDANVSLIEKHMNMKFEHVQFTCDSYCTVNIDDFDLPQFNISTPQGKRLLNQWIRAPLKCKNEIEKRLDIVEQFRNYNISLLNFPDIKKIVHRMKIRKINIPELLKVYKAIERVKIIIERIKEYPDESEIVKEVFIEPLTSFFKICSPLQDKIEDSIDFKTGRIKVDLNQELSRLNDEKISIFEKVESEFNDIKKLINSAKYHNKGFKITKTEYNEKKSYFSSDGEFNKKKFVVTNLLKNSVTFLSRNMSLYRKDLEDIEERVETAEREIINSIRDFCLKFMSSLEIFNYIIAMMDIFNCFSQKVGIYNRPSFSKVDYTVKGMFHPLLENKDCIVNDVSFNKNVMIITGPNMGGKSTFIKTLAMVSLFAQIGSFVPCELAVLPVFDKILMRIGAKDCSSRQLSTFMVEMMELNKILRCSTSESLVLIDELGRGTSAIDGFSLVSAVKEFLLEKNIRSVFATHFSELGCERTLNKIMAVDGDVLTYKIRDGVCDMSFGINVARKVRFPNDVIKLAEKYMNEE